MKKGFGLSSTLGRIAALWAVIAAGANGAAANGVFDANFVHKTHGASISLHYSEIHHPFTNGTPGGMLFVTPNQNPSGSSVLDFHNLGVWYDGDLLVGSLRWNVFHQDGVTAMVDGASFNVLVPHPDADAFVHVADVGNITANFTRIDHASINGDPNARIIVTQNWNPPPSAGVFNDHAIGVFYSQAAAKWAVFNQDLAAMPVGASFNVLVLPGTRARSHLHSADVLNTTGNRTFIDHAALNGNPDALVQVAQNWNPGLSTGVYNDHPVGVFYDGVQQRWAITNLDGLSIPLGADFNVLIPPEDEAVWAHGSAASNLGPGTTTMSFPLVDDELSPVLLTTPNLDLDGASGYPLDPTAVAYDSLAGRWYLRNQFGPSWTDDTFTNVYHPPINLRTFVHQAGVGNQQYTVFRHPLSDFDSNAIIFVQPHMNPADGPLVLMLDRVGVVWFDCAVVPGCLGSGVVWAVQTEFVTHAIADDASYNVHVSSTEAGAFKHTVGPLDPNFTVLDDPDLNGQPFVGILVTHNISDSNDFLDKTVGVRYDHGLARWKIATVDNSDLPTGHVFNVLALPEPDAALSLGAGIALLLLLRRRSRSGSV